MTVEARAVIAELRADGHGWTVIARTLNQRGVPTPSGRGSWYGETVRRHVHPEQWAAYMRNRRQQGPGRTYNRWTR